MHVTEIHTITTVHRGAGGTVQATGYRVSCGCGWATPERELRLAHIEDAKRLARAHAARP